MTFRPLNRFIVYHVIYFYPTIFGLPKPFHSRVKSRLHALGGRTDRHRASFHNAPSYGGQGIISPVRCFLSKGRFFLNDTKFLCHVLFLSALHSQSHSLHLLALIHPITLLMVFRGFSFPETFLR